MSSVLLPWLKKLSHMQQSVLLTAIRGPDGLPKRHVAKYLLRWLRRCIMYSAFDKVELTDPHNQRGGNFTGPIPRGRSLENLTAEYLQSVDEVPHHFHLHLVHAAEILGYRHPIQSVADFWGDFYFKAVEDMHMEPETPEHMEVRLGDNQAQWMAAGGEHLEDRV